MGGRSVKRQKRPVVEKTHNRVRKEPSGKYWITDVAAKATFFPIDLEHLINTHSRLLAADKNKVLITSHPVL